MNRSYELCFPREIVFGAGRLAKLPEYAPPGAKILLVLGNSSLANGLRERALALLKGFDVHSLVGVSAEAPLEEVDKLIGAGRSHGSTLVVAIGGGSVIDAAKAAAAIIPAGGLCADYFSGAKSLSGKGLPFIAAPTTAGTGSEITKNSVLTDAASKIKKSLRHKTMTPDVAIVDPELTLSCPKALSAASGLDAFIQAFEGYTNPLANAATQALSAKACAKIFRNLERVCEKPDALDARTEMAEGSMLSAMAFAQTGLGAIHGLAHPVGSLLHVPHGVSCAILMPYVMAWNLPLCRDAYGDLAKACGLDSAEDFVRESAALAGRLGVPSDLKPYGLRREHFPFIVKNCRSASMASNPRPMDDDAVESLLSKTL